jgi:hypothetical protein
MRQMSEENNNEEVVETPEVETPEAEEKNLVELSDEVQEAIQEDKITDPADTEEEGDDKEVDPNKPSTDIVFPEDSILTEEQQSGLSEILGSQENYDKIMTMLQDISAVQIEKDGAAAVATAEAKLKENEEALKKDPEFGKEYDANVKDINDLAKEYGAPESVDVKDPETAKFLLKIANERSDAKVHIENNKTVDAGPKKDIYGNSQVQFNKTMDQLKERK